MRVVESRGKRSAPLKPLRVSEIGGICVLRKNTARSRTDGTGGDGVVFVELQCARQLWIERGNGRPDAESRADQAVGAGAGATGGDGCSAGAGADGAAESTDASSGRVLHDAGIDAENVRSGFGAQ